MRLSAPKMTLLIPATALSLIAQGIAFAPSKFEFILQNLPAWGNLTSGAILFIASALIFVFALRFMQLGSRTSWILLTTQILTVASFFFLQTGSPSHLPEASFLFTAAITALTVFGVLGNQPLTTTEISISEQIEEVKAENSSTPQPYIESNSRALREQVESIARKLNTEKRRNTQLILLNELSQQLESELDPPVAAQLAVNMLDRALECSLVSLMMHEQENREFVALATSGKKASAIPPGYRQNSEKGLLGRVARLKKTQLVNDVSVDPDFIQIRAENTASEIAVPIMHNGQIKSIIEVCSEKPYGFGNLDVSLVEGVALELTRAWERSSYNQRLKELIQAGISLSTQLDPQTVLEEVALLARKTLEARFVFITLLDQKGTFSRTASAGDAPKLFNSLSANPAQEVLIQAALSSTKPFRIRDVRKYASAKNVEIDHGGLRSALVTSIRLHRVTIGTMLAFGKQEGVFFSENDESLAGLLASQAAASAEGAWLFQEMRTTLNNTSLLYQLSLGVIQTEDLSKAAELIVTAARKATNAKEAGMVLLSTDGDIQVEVELDESGFHSRRKHPMETIQQAVQTGHPMFASQENNTLACYPLQTRARIIGALWMDIPESHGQNFAYVQTMANQAAMTLERSNLLAESRRQAKQIEAAYQELQATYDQTLLALMSALDARDRETEGHSMRVSRLACLMGEKIGLPSDQLKALERGALLHDIGKIGISDSILHKPGKLTEDEWKIMRTHPDIGARIVERIPFLQECMPVVRYHHERWNGSGYPLGLKGQDIPIFARIFAVADVFDALTSKRSYRKSSTPDEAVAYLREQSNIQFDAEVVETLAQLPYLEFTEVEKAPS